MYDHIVMHTEGQLGWLILPHFGIVSHFGYVCNASILGTPSFISDGTTALEATVESKTISVTSNNTFEEIKNRKQRVYCLSYCLK